ncbi:uncharacterized protein N7498_002804 [Penicillium cinerascens]|uniref:Extracellular membrane protein CFEM domain-containing protein n=1 Tax=Penicillium cinerascens TaxID=70096 RepID=A0A9W9NAR3_9EURO|nr:uncharacterized protein N7498_002804 [Penicillium cinerascens]KAJ5216397.1 hypothetical protein N7498_002804 [Penicillium cinerascens]
MRIEILALLVWSLTSNSMASHNEHERQNRTLTQLEQNRLAVEQMPPACSLPACLGLSGTITCIVSAATSGDAAALQRCLSGGLTEICSCAACIPSVINFLTSLGICVASASPENSTSFVDTCYYSESFYFYNYNGDSEDFAS